MWVFLCMIVSVPICAFDECFTLFPLVIDIKTVNYSVCLIFSRLSPLTTPRTSPASPGCTGALRAGPRGPTGPLEAPHPLSHGHLEWGKRGWLRRLH